MNASKIITNENLNQLSGCHKSQMWIIDYEQLFSQYVKKGPLKVMLTFGCFGTFNVGLLKSNSRMPAALLYTTLISVPTEKGKKKTLKFS